MKLRRVLLALAVVAGLLSINASGASAQTGGCTDVLVAPGVILITPDPVFGPHPVSVPAGEYRLIVTSFDLGHVAGSQTDQQNEIWSFTTDTGYTSPRTPDLPDALTSQTYDLGVATFDSDISAITFTQHGVLPSYDSVRPEILFQCVSAASTTTTAAPTTTAPSTTAAPTTSSPAPTTTSGGEVLPTTVPAPTTSAGEVLPTSVVPSPSTPGSGGVGGGELPRTGSNTVVAWGGIALLAVGAVWLFTGRVSEEMVAGSES